MNEYQLISAITIPVELPWGEYPHSDYWHYLSQLLKSHLVRHSTFPA